MTYRDKGPFSFYQTWQANCFWKKTQPAIRRPSFPFVWETNGKRRVLFILFPRPPTFALSPKKKKKTPDRRLKKEGLHIYGADLHVLVFHKRLSSWIWVVYYSISDAIYSKTYQDLSETKYCLILIIWCTMSWWCYLFTSCMNYKIHIPSSSNSFLLLRRSFSKI